MAKTTADGYLWAGSLGMLFGAMLGFLIAAGTDDWGWFFIVGGIVGGIALLVLQVGLIAKGVEVGNRSGSQVGR